MLFGISCIHVYVLLSAIDPRADLSGPDWTDINVLTGCLKLYFRELPDPLIPFKFYRSVLNSTSKTIITFNVTIMCTVISCSPSH